MKKLLLLAVLALTGCVGSPKKSLQLIPDGDYKAIHATITGKFSATQLDASDAKISEGKLTAGKLHVRHSNAYVPLIELDLEAAAPAPAAPLVSPVAAAK